MIEKRKRGIYLAKKPLPIALITGYLGAGKTTLLNRILSNPQGHKIAVIVNDIGEVNIDASLIEKKGAVTQMDNSLVPLQNGCICCTLSNDLIDQIDNLGKMDDFDYILIEASGVCEPQPIAENITMSQETAQMRGLDPVCYLDNIACVVDAKRMADEFECGTGFAENKEQYQQEEDIRALLIQQIEFANLVILNKAELVSDQEKENIKKVIVALNPNAKIVEATYGEVDMDELLDTGRFDFDKAYYGEGWVKAMDDYDKEQKEHHHHHHEHHEHDHDHHEHDHHHHHHHHDHDHGETEEYGIGTFVYHSRDPFRIDLLEKVAGSWPASIIRTKGYCWFEHDPKTLYVFEQAGSQIALSPDGLWLAACGPQVQEKEFELRPEIKETWDEKYGDRENKIVFIGKDMDQQAIIQMMDDCLVKE